MKAIIILKNIKSTISPKTNTKKVKKQIRKF